MTIAITPLPTPPSRADSTNFSARGDAFMAALPLLQSEANAQNVENNAHNANINAQVAAALAAGLANAATNAAAAAANAATASAQNAAAGTSASAAATSAASAATARDLSIAAWSASTAPAEQLAALSQSLHIGAIVKAIVYDTSKDSDGGAWRLRCQDKSWYTETLGGSRWIGQEATIAAAWTDAGSTTGAVFQASATAGPLTIGKHYAATSATTATEVTRGITPGFPAVAGIVAESSRVVIYDLAAPGCPMWMVFPGINAGIVTNVGPISSIAARDSALVICDARSSSTLYGAAVVNFSSDKMRRYTASAQTSRESVLGIANRQTATFFDNGAATALIVNGTVNDVAITVLDNAPIDPATGLPVPTIAVATSGGVSVIRDNGTVVNITATGVATSSDIAFEGGNVTFAWDDTAGRKRFVKTYGIPAANISESALYTKGSAKEFYTALANGSYTGHTVFGFPFVGNNDARKIMPLTGALIAQANVYGVAVGKRNSSDQSKLMQAYITNAYNSGWQVGDIRGAWLADTVAETITGLDALTGDSSTFTGGVGAWTTGNATIAADSGHLLITGNGVDTFPKAGCALNFIVGKTYVISFDMVAGAVGSGILLSGETLSPQSGAGYYYPVTAGRFTTSFVAAGASRTLQLIGPSSNSSIARFDNIFVKLAEPDRSVKNNGLNIVGTLTKARIDAATTNTASLVAYSGFSAANYLEQPYNSQLDFGTGDFSVMGWADITSTADQTIFDRGVGGSNRLALFIVSTFYYVTCSATGVTTVTTVSPVLGRVYIDVIRLNGFLQLYINSVLVFSVANTANITSSSGPLRFGVGLTGAGPMLGSLSLWRVSATAPSADQIAQIYRDELALFQPGAQCTIAGTSTAVTAMAYDEDTTVLHVGTSWGRSGFEGLLRVDSEATTTGALTSLSASGGTVLTGGTSGRVYQPALKLRDELKRKDLAAKALGKVPVFFEFDIIGFTAALTNASTTLTASAVSGTPYVGMGITGTGIVQGTVITSISGATYTISIAATATASNAVAQAGFALPPGYTYKAVYSAGVLKRIGSNKDFTVATDGYKETINFNISPGSTAWVSIMAIKG